MKIDRTTVYNCTGIPTHPSMYLLRKNWLYEVKDPSDAMAQQFYDLSWYNGTEVPCYEEVDSRIEGFVDLVEELLGDHGHERIIVECEGWLLTRLSQALLDKQVCPCSTFWVGDICKALIPHFED